jgi:hypothetical protein
MNFSLVVESLMLSMVLLSLVSPGVTSCFFSVDEFFSSCRIVDVVNGATVVGFAGGDVMFTFGGSVGFLSSI